MSPGRAALPSAVTVINHVPKRPTAAAAAIAAAAAVGLLLTTWPGVFATSERWANRREVRPNKLMGRWLIASLLAPTLDESGRLRDDGTTLRLLSVRSIILY